MRDWSHDLRGRLAELRLSPAREAEIVEELSQHLDDRYEELRANGSSDADARRLAVEELSEAGGLAQRMQGPVAGTHAGAGRPRATGRRPRARRVAGRALRLAYRQKAAGFRGHDCLDARVGHRRQHHGVHHRQRGGASPSAVRGRGTARPARCTQHPERAEPFFGLVVPRSSGLANRSTHLRGYCSGQ